MAITLVEATDADRVDHSLPLGEAKSVRSADREGVELGFIFKPMTSDRWRFRPINPGLVEYLTGEQLASVGEQLQTLNEQVLCG